MNPSSGVGMKGLDAVKRAVEDAGVKAITCVPGYPITEAIEAVGAEISVNEKVALEIALGASATGARAMVLTKQLGMNLLADPLVISVTHTIGSGLVVLVGDDIGPKGSQAEMDSRAFGPLDSGPAGPCGALCIYHRSLPGLREPEDSCDCQGHPSPAFGHWSRRPALPIPRVGPGVREDLVESNSQRTAPEAPQGSAAPC